MPDNEITGNIFYFAGTEAINAAAARKPSVDAALVERICNGDDAAFGEFYRMFAPMVHGIVLARVRREEVDDIVQDVFVSAHKNLSGLRVKEAVGGWLAMIARNKAAEFYRRERPSEELSDDLPGHLNRGSEAREILQTLRTLPETYRETLVMRLVEGMTGHEIAERTGLTPDSVRVNLYRGMSMLRNKLGIEVRKK